MTTKLKVAIVFSLLLISTLLVACEDGTDRSKVEYLEKEITLPEGIEYISDFQIFGDDVIRIAGAKNQTKDGSVWESKNGGKDWNKVISYTSALHINEEDNVECFAYVSEWGKTLCITYYYDASYENADVKCHLVDDTGTVTEIKNQFPDSNLSESMNIGNGFSYYGVILDANHLLLSTKGGEAYIVDSETSDVASRIVEKGDALIDATAFAVKGNHEVICLGLKNNYTYDTNSGSTRTIDDNGIKKLRSKYGDYDSDVSCKFAASDSGLYLVNDDGITRFTSDGEERLIKARNMDYKPSSDNAPKKLLEANGRIYLALNLEGDAVLETFEKGEREDEGKNVTLKVYTLTNHDGIRQLIDEFERENKDVDVELTIGMSEGDEPDDALKKLNTKILGGDGPDVLFMDGININNYIDNSALLDIRDVIKQYDDYISDMEGLYKKGDSIYAVSTRFAMPVVVYDKRYEDLPKSTADMRQFIEYVKDNRMDIDEYDFGNMIRYVYHVYMGDVIIDGSVNRSLLETYMELMKELYQCTGAEHNINLANLYKEEDEGSGIISGLTEESELNTDYITSGKALQEIEYLEHYGIFYAENENRLRIVPKLIMGVTASATNADIGKRLIEFALSDNGQLISGESIGLPVRKSAIVKSLEEMSTDVLTVASDTGREKTYKLKQFDGEAVSGFLKIADREKSPVKKDSLTMKIIMEYLAKFINGDISMDNAVESIENRLELYASE